MIIFFDKNENGSEYMQVDILLFFILIFYFFALWLWILYGVYLTHKCFYLLGLFKYNNVFLSLLSGEFSSIKPSVWYKQIISSQIEIPNNIKPLVTKLKYTEKINRLGFLVILLFIILIFIANRYHWVIHK